MFSERSVRVSDRGEKTVVIFLTCGRMLLAATGEKKLLVNDKITACAKEICRLGVVCKVSNREILSGETFCLPEILLSILNFVLRVTYCFLHTADWPTTDVLGMYCYFPIIWLVNFV